MSETRALLADHITTRMPRADKVFPGAYALALSDGANGPSLVVMAPEGVKVPDSYTFEAGGVTVTVPVWHSVQPGVDEEMLERLKRKPQAKAEPQRQAA